MQSSESFFKSIIASQICSHIDCLILVAHLNQETSAFIKALSSFAKIAAILPKTSSKKHLNLDEFESTYKILHYSRAEIIADKENFLKQISELVGTSRFAIIDMGGYFSHVYSELLERFNNKLIGLVEDTENGHQKYENAIAKNSIYQRKFPIISVARSTLKDPEDALVGNAIVFSAEAILRSVGIILTGKKILVIGFGKIGRSISSALLSRGIRVDIYDTNPIRLASSLSLGFHSASREDLIKCADILFCATGNGSIGIKDFRNFKNGLFIFSATSSDDEWQACLKKEFKENGKKSNKLIDCLTYNKKKIYICNEGDSVNFVHGGVVGSFINLVQGEMLYAISRLEHTPPSHIYEIPDASKKFIAAQWLKSHGISAFN
ncbi:NAD(P)-dependent oxidoreductase [Polynucleobacter sp. IMCC 30228]|uniref:NAD(P)-dependent oxidoreductase n=1 Tax=Polynucleobacter sp. IMCC 30228 TaxID=2781011 RepID=UPI001F3A52C4|nr:NAD(P)-dependent oxidoreductase [Polynucleobacter sp. IMCC 30228]MCE7526845.1 adenosylhomocysteinase [Polynucleobacter sp. IMCC 30228]